MEEKKLTDEEIVMALECCTKPGRCTQCPYFIKGIDCVNKQRHEKDILDFIHSLQNENATLKTELRKECEEHEEFTKKAKEELERLTEEANVDTITHIDLCTEILVLRKQKSELQKKVNKLNKTINKRKAEIERLTERLDYFQKTSDYHEGNQKELEAKNAELQKQVDELEEEYENMQAEIVATEERRLQAVKDTAKEWYGIVNYFSLYYPHGQIPYSVFEERLNEFAKSKGVEVE